MIRNTIQHVSDWANSWALHINKSNTVSTLFSLSTSKENVKLTLDNHPVPQVETSTFLGITLDSRLSWKTHKSIQETLPHEETCRYKMGVLAEKSFAMSILAPYAQLWNMHLLRGSPPPKPTKTN